MSCGAIFCAPTRVVGTHLCHRTWDGGGVGAGVVVVDVEGTSTQVAGETER